LKRDRVAITGRLIANMAGLRGLMPVLLVLGVIFGPDAYKVLSNVGTSPEEVRITARGALKAGCMGKLL
jgi:hypothetical protein